MREVAERWAAAEPRDETPYREWGLAALARRDVGGGAARVPHRAGATSGRADALAAELAQTAIQQQDWPLALREWLAAIGRVPGYRSSAVATLGPTPEAARPELLRLLGIGPRTRRPAARGRAPRSLGRSRRRVRGAVRGAAAESLGGDRGAGGIPGSDPVADGAGRAASAGDDAGGAGRAELRSAGDPVPAGRGAGVLRCGRPERPRDACSRAWPPTPRRPGGAASSGRHHRVGVLLAEGKPEEAERRLAALARLGAAVRTRRAEPADRVGMGARADGWARRHAARRATARWTGSRCAGAWRCSGAISRLPPSCSPRRDRSRARGRRQPAARHAARTAPGGRGRYAAAAGRGAAGARAGRHRGAPSWPSSVSRASLPRRRRRRRAPAVRGYGGARRPGAPRMRSDCSAPPSSRRREVGAGGGARARPAAARDRAGGRGSAGARAPDPDAIPRVRSCRRRAARSTRPAARCPAHETAHASSRRRRRRCSASRRACGR